MSRRKWYDYRQGGDERGRDQHPTPVGSEVRRHAQWRTMKAKLLTPERIAFYNTQHRKIYEAISTRDTPTAVQLIKQHLYGVHDDLLETE